MAGPTTKTFPFSSEFAPLKVSMTVGTAPRVLFHLFLDLLLLLLVRLDDPVVAVAPDLASPETLGPVPTSVLILFMLIVINMIITLMANDIIFISPLIVPRLCRFYGMVYSLFLLNLFCRVADSTDRSA